MTGLRQLFCRLAITLPLLGAGLPAQADGPVVVELFTSQGCSSCPPADAMLGELADRRDVIALSLHVDYWDYIGWEDTFADASFTRRQHQYARVAGSTVVYTPQMVIGGVDHVVGVRPMETVDLIMAHSALPDPVQVTVERQGGSFVVTASRAGQIPRGGVDVQLIGYSPRERVEIGRGENANRTIDYHNVVVSMQQIADWDGRGGFNSRITPGDAPAYVVIFQASDQGAILGAARLQ